MNEMNTYTYLLLNRGRPLGLHNKQQGSLNFYSHLKEELDDFWLEITKPTFQFFQATCYLFEDVLKFQIFGKILHKT